MGIYEVVALCREAGFSGLDLPIAVAVAKAESRFNPNAIGDVGLVNWKWGPSIGLFQIRSLKMPWLFPRPDRLRVRSKLFDPAYNCATAKAIHRRYGWQPWSTFNSGDYFAFLAEAQTAVNGEGVV